MKRINLLLLVAVVLFVSCEKPNKKKPKEEETFPAAVDLGLSVLWGEANVGADRVTDRGSLFQWAGVTPSADCLSKDAPYYDENTKTYTKYSRKNQPTLLPEDDAATQTLKDGWRMPTITEMDELREKCSFEMVTVDGKKLAKVTGPNGKFIYLPVSGQKMNKKEYETDRIYFWTNSIHVGDGAPDSGSDLLAIAFCAIPSEASSTKCILATDFLFREVGIPVRPVKDKK